MRCIKHFLSHHMFENQQIGCYTLNTTKPLITWISVSSTGKISDSCIRNLGFNPHLYQKLIGVLV